jgi:flavin reductase (DIM6/NTAB) family NADH-FMN oxidoreductase RutF
MFRAIEPKILYFGTPVVLVSSLNEDETTNIAPISSAWALGWNVLIGLGKGGKTYENLGRHPECVLNFPAPHLWDAVERLAPLTGKNPVPTHKQSYSRFEPDKFAAAGFTPLPAGLVQPQRILECPLQLEGKVVKMIPIGTGDDVVAVEVEILKVHAHPSIIIGEHHINPTAWQPLIYNFRHYFGLGKRLGKSFRAEDSI